MAATRWHVVCDVKKEEEPKKDTNGDVLWTWSYPAITDQKRVLFMRKTCLSSGSESFIPFLYSQLDRKWYYIYTCSTQEVSSLPKVNAFSLVLYTKDFNPEKYEALCKILAEKYCTTGSPTAILESYLSVVTKGTCDTAENGKFATQDYNIKHAYANSDLTGIIESFGVETILIYTACLLKKRIAIYFPPHALEDLLKFTRAVPAFVWHRQNWGLVYPYVELQDEELDELRSNTSYIAGFIDATVEGRNDLYDVFINGSTSQISIAQHAKDAMAMGKLHKDIAMAMVKAIENNESHQQVIKEIANKTKDLLNNLKSLADEDGTITLEALKERKMPPATENFLFTLAACEGLVPM